MELSVGAANKALYAIFVLLFLAYVAVSDDATFLLASFAAFLAAVPLLALDRRLIGRAVVIGSAALLAGSIAYSFPLSVSVALLYTIIAVPIGGLLAYRLRLGNADRAVALAAGFLPLALYAAGLQRSWQLALNFACIGYYLLIASAMAIFALAVYQNLSGRGPRSGKGRFPVAFRSLLRRNAALVQRVLLLVAVLLLVSPIWISGSEVRTSALPYVPIALSGMSGSGRDYAIAFNALPYQRYENYRLGNLRFFYPDGRPLKAELAGSGDYSSPAAVFLLENLTSDSVRLAFLPVNATFDSYLEPVADWVAGAVPQLTAAFGAISGGRNYSNASAGYVEHETAGNASGLTSAPSYSLTGSICHLGVSASVVMAVTSDETASAFLLKNGTDLSSALKAAGLSGPYGSRIGQFLGPSAASALNSSAIRLDYGFPANSTCVFYAVVTDGPANVSVGTSLSYYTKADAPSSYLPEVPAPGGAYLVYRTGFLPQGLAYLASTYLKAVFDA